MERWLKSGIVVLAVFSLLGLGFFPTAFAAPAGKDALLLAVPPAEIRVAQGIYKPDCNAAHPAGTGNRAATFQLRSGVALRGGYAGLGAADPDAWDIALYVSILSGDLLGNDGPNFANYGENSYHVVTGDGTDAAAICEGLTIEAGNTPSAPEDGYEGGGIRIAAGAPTIQVCTIRRNMATLGGGVYAGRGADPTITACTISENTARSGAGVYCGGGAATIAGCSVSGNSVTGTGDAYGGGLYFRGGATGSVTDCSITGNRATAGASRSAVGAGICVWDSYAALLIARCTIADNRAESLYAAEGGGAEFSSRPHHPQSKDHLSDRLAPGSMEKGEVGQHQSQSQRQSNGKDNQDLTEDWNLPVPRDSHGQAQETENHKDGHQEHENHRIRGHSHGPNPKPAPRNPLYG